MPDIGAEGGKQEADACEDNAAEGSGPPLAGPSSGEECKQEWHGQVHDAV